MKGETQALDPPRTTEKSDSVHRAARAVMSDQGSAASDRPILAAPASIAAAPIIARGKGATVTDLDGNDYIDYALAGGTIILGHADERVVAAISKAASKGFGFSDPTEAQVRLAEMIVGRFASIDMVRFTRSRARAIANAIRIARATTGRRSVLVVRDSIAERVARAADAGVAFCEAVPARGSFDSADGGHTIAVDAVRSEPAQPSGNATAGRTNSTHGRNAILEALKTHGGSLAAVVLEPFSLSTGLCDAPADHLTAIRALCSEHGALLIFDDAVTGLRIGVGGSEAVTGVSPDLTCLGAELGAGLPLAALGGRKEIMIEAVRTAELSVAGDAPTDDLAVSAGVAVLQALNEPDCYEQLNARAERLACGIREMCDSASSSIRIQRVSSLVAIRGAVQPSGAGNVSVTEYAPLFDALLAAGIMPPSDPVSPWALSLAHQDEDVDRTVESFARIVADRLTK